jgi:cytochrome c biogenesis protein CcmG, thiol:disulfide interchange protein DsbE
MQSVKTNLFLKIAIVALLAALVYVIYDGMYERVIGQGDSAPAFTVVADSGATISVPNFGGKVLVLNFWATWCPPCVQETPSLSEFAAQFKDKGVVVLALSVDRDEKVYRAFLNKYKPAFLTARDFTVHADYGTFIYPETYIIDARGKVQMKIPEGADWSDPRLAQFVSSLL